MLTSKEQKIQKLKYVENLIATEVEEAVNKRNFKEIEKLQKKYKQETLVKQKAIKKIDELKQEIKLLEAGNANATSIRQLKEICRELQIENESLKAQLLNAGQTKSLYEDDISDYKQRLESKIINKESKLLSSKRTNLRETANFHRAQNSEVDPESKLNISKGPTLLEHGLNSSVIQKGDSNKLEFPEIHGADERNHSEVRNWKMQKATFHK